MGLFLQFLQAPFVIFTQALVFQTINLRMDSLHPSHISKEITNTARADVVSWCWTWQYGIFYSPKTADKDGVVLTEHKSDKT